MPAVEWKREDVLSLIAAYREQPCLWNVKSQGYKDRNAKDIALKKVYNEMKIIDNNMTLEAMKTKIHTIRSQFKRELKLIRESKNSGASTSDVYTPKLWCFHLLEFIPNDELGESTSTLDITCEVCNTFLIKGIVRS